MATKLDREIDRLKGELNELKMQASSERQPLSNLLRNLFQKTWIFKFFFDTLLLMPKKQFLNFVVKQSDLIES